MRILTFKRTPIILLTVLVFQLSVSVNTFSTEVDREIFPEPISIKCGECPCVNPCSHQSPPPPPPPENRGRYCSPPPPSPVYVAAETIPPPPPRFNYVTGAPGNLYPTDDPFNLMVYSNAAINHYLINVGIFLLVVHLMKVWM
ncbi:hypothetical protein ABFX02_12G025800 [Erythranthe guttata]